MSAERSATPVDDETFDLLRSNVRRFVRDRLVPAENDVEEHDRVPDDIVREMRELGPLRPVRSPRSTVASASP